MDVAAPRKKVTVYGLASSEDGKIRYVGQTTNSLSTRLRAHKTERPNTYKARWIRSVHRNGFSVVCFVIDRDAEWNETEIRLIAWYRKNGARLTNATSGGEGILNPSAEVRAKISAANPRTPLTPERKAKMIAGLRARKFSDEHKAINAEVCRKRNATPEQREAIRRYRTGLKVSAETLKKMAAVSTGRVKSDQSKKKVSESVKKSWENPERLIKHRMALYRRYADMLVNQHGV